MKSLLLPALILSSWTLSPHPGSASTALNNSRLAEADRPPADVELHALTKGVVTAHWSGVKPKGADTPLTHGVSQLWFTFEGDDTRYPLKLEGTLFHTDWRFDIFSPDGKYVLLLMSRYGPYHVVAAEQLKAYLEGSAKADEVVWKAWVPGEHAHVHRDGQWIGPREFEYVIGGETEEKRRHKIRQKSNAD